MAKKKVKAKKPVWGPSAILSALRKIPKGRLEATIYTAMLILYSDPDLSHGIDPDKQWDSGTVEDVAESLKNVFTQQQLDAIMGEENAS